MSNMGDGPCADTCVLDGYDGDPSEYCKVKLRKARRQHECCECGEAIASGTTYEHTSGKWDGELATFKVCPLCVEIRTKFSCGGGWTFCGMWEALRDALFGRLTFGCLDGLSIPAREKVLAEWRRWKGLAA